MNPLHADPAVARKAGFERPILHGQATYGVAGQALLQAVCGYDASRIAEIAARFTAPVYPGETLRTEIWVDGEQVSFTVRVPVRDVVAIGNGRAVIRAARS
jgi:acyl dehydratase